MDDAERTIRRLRAGAREQQEDAEAVVAELVLATRTLREAILDHGRRGSPVRIEFGSSSVSGVVVHIGTDLARVQSANGHVTDVALSGATSVRIEASRRAPAPVSVGHPESVLARCRELVQSNAEVEIARRDSSVLRGRLMAANGSHIELLDTADRAWLVPIDAVCWVRRVDR